MKFSVAVCVIIFATTPTMSFASQTSDTEEFARFLNSFSTYEDVLVYLSSGKYISPLDRQDIERQLAQLKVKISDKLVKTSANQISMQWNKLTINQDGKENLKTDQGRIVKLPLKLSAAEVFKRVNEAVEPEKNVGLWNLFWPEAWAQTVFETLEQKLRREAKASAGVGSVVGYAIKSTVGTVWSKTLEGAYSSAGAIARVALYPLRPTAWTVVCDKENHYKILNPPDLKSLSDTHEQHERDHQSGHHYSSHESVNLSLDAATHYFFESFKVSPEEVIVRDEQIRKLLKTSVTPGCNSKVAKKVEAQLQKQIAGLEARLAASVGEIGSQALASPGTNPSGTAR